MKWNLRLVAAQRGIWTASELKRLLADRGMVISAGKMSGLWSGQPASIKLTDLEVLCAVLDAGPDELLLPEPDTIPTANEPDPEVKTSGQPRPASVRPRPRAQRSLPPEP